MKTISREELKAKLDRGEDVKLVMTMSGHAYDWLHIPGSLHFDQISDAVARLNRDAEIVLYCTNSSCNCSQQAYHVLRSKGFEKVYHYPGGLTDWEEAGFPLEGSLAAAHSHT